MKFEVLVIKLLWSIIEFLISRQTSIVKITELIN